MRYDSYNYFIYFKIKINVYRCLFFSRSITLLSSFDIGIRSGIYVDKQFTSITKMNLFFFFFQL
jgi:hypothetical protein